MDKDVVRRIANLARLSLSEAEQLSSAEKLGQVLKHFEKLAAINTDEVEPLVTPTEIENFMRSDEVSVSLSTEELMKNAPSSQGHLFKVPPVVGS